MMEDTFKVTSRDDKYLVTSTAGEIVICVCDQEKVAEVIAVQLNSWMTVSKLLRE
jgi:hypothetical protein